MPRTKASKIAAKAVENSPKIIGADGSMKKGATFGANVDPNDHYLADNKNVASKNEESLKDAVSDDASFLKEKDEKLIKERNPDGNKSSALGGKEPSNTTVPETAPTNRDNAGILKKGASSKLRRRSKIILDEKAMLKAVTVEAVQLLIDTMRDENVKPELRVKCAESIMERVYGKTPQPIEGDLTGGIMVSFAGEMEKYAE